jgi:hypothetical protein
MKREYFGILFIVVSGGILFILENFVGENFVKDNCFRFLVIWLLIAFYLGQYSMRFPKIKH